MYISQEELKEVSLELSATFKKIRPLFGSQNYLNILEDIRLMQEEEDKLKKSRSEKKQKEIREKVYYIKKRLVIQLKNLK